MMLLVATTGVLPWMDTVPFEPSVSSGCSFLLNERLAKESSLKRFLFCKMMFGLADSGWALSSRFLMRTPVREAYETLPPLCELLRCEKDEFYCRMP